MAIVCWRIANRCKTSSGSCRDPHRAGPVLSTPAHRQRLHCPMQPASPHPQPPDASPLPAGRGIMQQPLDRRAGTSPAGAKHSPQAKARGSDRNAGTLAICQRVDNKLRRPLRPGLHGKRAKYAGSSPTAARHDAVIRIAPTMACKHGLTARGSKLRAAVPLRWHAGTSPAGAKQAARAAATRNVASGSLRWLVASGCSTMGLAALARVRLSPLAPRQRCNASCASCSDLHCIGKRSLRESGRRLGTLARRQRGPSTMQPSA